MRKMHLPDALGVSAAAMWAFATSLTSHIMGVPSILPPSSMLCTQNTTSQAKSLHNPLNGWITIRQASQLIATHGLRALAWNLCLFFIWRSHCARLASHLTASGKIAWSLQVQYNQTEAQDYLESERTTDVFLFMYVSSNNKIISLVETTLYEHSWKVRGAAFA